MLIIMGTGRSGTATLARMVGGHHEYRVQYLLDKYFSKTTPYLDPFDTLGKRIVAMLDLFQGIETGDFKDSSNLYIHFIDAVYILYPSARFILSVRNGKDFARSTFSRRWHERTVFGNVPLRDDPYFGRWDAMSPLQKNAWLWTCRNSKALEGLKAVPDEQKLIVRIEDLAREDILTSIEKFTGTEIRRDLHSGKKYNSNPFFSMPPKEDWSNEMNREFDEIAGGMMKMFGYYS